eukprot:gene34170-biopygen18138
MFAANESGICVALNIDLDSADETSAVALSPPTIRLLGPAQLSVGLGKPYAACPDEGRDLFLVYDPGAYTEDVQPPGMAFDGNLRELVVACSPNGVENRFAHWGVSKCGIDTGIPGKYSIVFSVSSSTGLTSSVTRTLAVLAACPMGERYEYCTHSQRTLWPKHDRCEIMDGPQAGTASARERLRAALSGSGPARHGKQCTLDKTSLGSDEPAADAPPTVTLQSASGVRSAYVEVKQHRTYEPYREADTNRTEVGCLNTSATVDTVFEIPFMVFDSMVSAQNATVHRVVTIIAACSVNGEELCDDMLFPFRPAMRSYFSPCTFDTTPPTITLLQPSPRRVLYSDANALAGLRHCGSLVEGADGEPDECLALRMIHQ